jgi:cyclopropane-fatty-acyl-phospholipid synthase
VRSPSASSLEHRLLRIVHNSIGRPPIRLVLADRAEIAPPNERPVATVVFSNRQTLAKLLLQPEAAFGDGYADGSIRVEGDLLALLEAVSQSMKRPRRGNWNVKLISRWMNLAQANTLRGSAKNIHHHYDLDVNFYKLWLDSRMVYTCAYFPTPEASLEDAQLAKMDHVCKKVQIQPGEKVVEAGCGWGALAIHMAKHYGANVKAFNISKEQIGFARESARREGLAHQVEFIQDDYRNISGQFDAFVSVGMLEHIGAAHYADLARVIHRTIGDSGRGLLHFIGRNFPRPLSPWIRKRIFPGAHAPVLSQAVEIFEPYDTAVLDVENLRFHYAKTLEHWLARFERAQDRVAAMFSEEFVRMWRLYLAGSLAAFRTGGLQLFQVVFAGSECQRIPWTRAHLYEDVHAAEKEAKWMHATP